MNLGTRAREAHRRSLMFYKPGFAAHYEAEKLPAMTPERPLTLPLGVHSSGAQAHFRTSLVRTPCRRSIADSIRKSSLQRPPSEDPDRKFYSEKLAAKAALRASRNPTYQ